MDYSKNAQRDLEVTGISAFYCRKLHPVAFVVVLFCWFFVCFFFVFVCLCFFKTFSQSPQKHVFAVGLWGQKSWHWHAAPGQRSSEDVSVLGLVPGLCLCSFRDMLGHAGT